ncbi:MAG: hypothetical protein JO235_25895, partial [Chroococcidiopsidaceae cyanobacterium CP_BM_RX_35]|nr:hypothetical protein [Chroococcidiopsidaceae cyanobacterium CP_BM_RX_35]
MVKAKVQLPPPPSVVAKNGIVPIDRNGHQVAPSVGVSYSIVHVIPGRVRFRVPRLLHDADFAQQLQMVLEAETQVTRIRINRDAASVAITYQSTTSDAKMRSHLVHLLQKAAELVVLTFKSSSQQPTAHTTSSQPALKLSALATTLAVMGGPLGLPIPAVIVAGTIVFAALPVAQRAVAGVREQRRLNIDFLDLMAITITTLQGNFLTPSLMLGLIEIGDRIRERTAQKSKLQTLNLL